MAKILKGFRVLATVTLQDKKIIISREYPGYYKKLQMYQELWNETTNEYRYVRGISFICARIEEEVKTN